MQKIVESKWSSSRTWKKHLLEVKCQDWVVPNLSDIHNRSKIKLWTWGKGYENSCLKELKNINFGRSQIYKPSRRTIHYKWGLKFGISHTKTGNSWKIVTLRMYEKAQTKITVCKLFIGVKSVEHTDHKSNAWQGPPAPQWLSGVDSSIDINSTLGK